MLGEEGSCRPGQKASLVMFSAAGIGDKGCIPPLDDLPPPAFFSWELVAFEGVYTQSREEQDLQAVKALLGHLLPFSELGRG